MSAVDGPVHVNGHGRNQKRRMVKRYQLGNNLPVIFYKQTSYYGKRAVKPGTHNHSAIAFYIETGVFAVPHLRIFFNLESRRITVCGSDFKSIVSVFGNGKGNQGRTVSCDYIFSAPLNLPGIFFTDFRESCIEKGCFDMTDRMKNKRGFTDKVQ